MNLSWSCPVCGRTNVNIRICDGEDAYIVPDDEWNALLEAGEREEKAKRRAARTAHSRRSTSLKPLPSGPDAPVARFVAACALCLIAFLPILPSIPGVFLTLPAASDVGRADCIDDRPCVPAVRSAVALRINYGRWMGGPGTAATSDRTYLALFDPSGDPLLGLTANSGEGQIGTVNRASGWFPGWTASLDPDRPFPPDTGAVEARDRVVLPLENSKDLSHWVIGEVPQQDVLLVRSPLSRVPLPAMLAAVAAALWLGYQRASVRGLQFRLRLAISMLSTIILATWFSAAMPRTLARALGATQASPGVSIASLIAMVGALLVCPIGLYLALRQPAEHWTARAMDFSIRPMPVRGLSALVTVVALVLSAQVLDQFLANVFLGWAP